MTEPLETPEEYLERLTQTINSEEGYLSRVYGENYDDDPDIEDYLDPPPARPLSLPEEMQWRLDCARYPDEPPCDECIFKHYQAHPIFIGGFGNGKPVPDDVADQDIIGVPASVLCEPPSFGAEDFSPVVSFSTERYTRRTIRVFLNENEDESRRRLGFIHFWVLDSITDPNEAFRMFYNYVRGD